MKKTKLIYLIFLLYPILDLLTAIQARYCSFPVTVGVIFRSLFIVALFFYVVFISKDKYRQFSIVYLSLLCLFSIGYLLTKMSANITDLLTEITYLFKVFSFPLILWSLIVYFHEYGIDKHLLKKILKINALSFMLLLLIPLITKTGFNTYYEAFMLKGTIGYFYAANEISGIIILLLPLLYLNIENVSKWWALVIILYAYVALSIGTKVVLLGVILISLIMLLKSLFTKKGRIVYLITFIAIIGLAYLSPSYHNIVDRKERIDNTIAYQEINYLAVNVKSTDDDSVTDILVSGRTEYLKSNQDAYQNSSLRYQLFGLGMTKYRYVNLTEMDYFDIFYRLGIIGSIIYLIPFVYLSVIIIKNFKFKMTIFAPCLIIILAGGIALMAGHIITAPAVSIYVVMAIILLLTEINLFNNLKRDKKVMYISTTGGHLTEILNLKPLFEKYQTYIVTEKTSTNLSLKDDYKHVSYLLFGSDRHHIIAYGIRLLANCFISLSIYLKTRPDVIVSTGAHFSGPMLCIGKLLGSKVVFIETLANIESRSKTGNLVYRFADLFIVQWDNMLKVYPKAIKRGGLK